MTGNTYEQAAPQANKPTIEPLLIEDPPREVRMVRTTSLSEGRKGSRSYVAPHRTLSSEFRQPHYVHPMVAVLFAMVLSYVIFFMSLKGDKCMCHSKMKDECYGALQEPMNMTLFEETSVPSWKPAIVFNLLVLFCVLVIEGANPEMCLLGVAALAVVTNCLDPDKLFTGASSSAVVSLALLFPIAKALAETGVPDAVIGMLIGNPRQVGPGIGRMFLALFPPSPFFNNTPIVAMMIPVLKSWSERLGFDTATLLMPLTFCAQAGGNLSLMGSSINFVAKEILERNAEGFELGFWDLSLGGAILYGIVGIYSVLFAPILLRGNDLPGDQLRDNGSKDMPYEVAVKVAEFSPLVGVSPEQAGLHRVKGVDCLSSSLTLLRGHAIVARRWAEVSQFPLQPHDVLNIKATAEGVVALRQVRGLVLANETDELSRLGAMRRKRVLVEASVSAELVGKKLDVRELRKSLRCAVVAISGTPAPAAHPFSHDGHVVERDNVLLLEVFRDEVASGAWSDHFGVTRFVPKSSPPRTGRRPDTLRAVTMGLGLLTVVCLAMLSNKRIALPVTCTLLLCLLFLIKAVSVEDAYAAVNVPVLMTILGALALGSALEEVNLAGCFADKVVGVAQPYGGGAILIALYLATFAMGFFVTNAAVVAIMGQIGASIALDPSTPINIGEVCFVVVYGASACFCTPYGYQTNLMVAKEAGYSWGDFVKFGLPLQVVHLVAVVLMAPTLSSFVFPDAQTA
eukprot:TRINITY_DN10860_c0_g2_i1.p1 TRINITY_DN10860_c0_g2~~TRINITY_DN10860_c0_g2_i1.p1  ORF type:complete len:740 (-),score=104.41 TRINITY_DN10860_c0_g2_i1:206-2425(-)